MTPPPIPAAGGPLQVKSLRYTLRRGDILRWQFRLLVHNRVLLGLWLLLSLFMVWGELRTPALAGRTLGFKVIYVVIYTVCLLGFLGGFTMLMVGLMSLFKKYRGVLGEHELEIREEGLMERTEVNESLHRWKGFHRIIQTRRYLYIYVTDNNVHIVPRRCFVSTQQEEAFRAELEKRRQAG